MPPAPSPAPDVPPTTPDPDVTLRLAPACDPGTTEPSALVVALSVPATEHPVFRLDDEVMGTPGMADLITEASAADDRGSLPLVRRVRDRVLELAPARRAIGTITLRYTARSVSTTDDGAREGLRHDATGIGGHGRHFLVLPDEGRRYTIRVAWGAPRCPTATRGEGASTFGAAASSDTAGDLGTLREAVYYWGRPQKTATDDGSLHLRTSWFGEPAFDPAVAGAWAARAFAAERAFFGDDDPTPFSIFVRVLTSHGDRANGIATETSMLSAIGPRTTFSRRLEVNLAHEMFHRWLGQRLRLRGPEGTAYWFSEGFTVHYSNVIAFRAGLLTVDELLESMNDIATRHFDNKHARATNDQIRRGFYRDPELAIVPYTRGALYAAELDAALRRASHGKRSLDEVLRELYRHARAPAGRDGLPADALRRIVRAELGRTGVERYDAVIARGADPDPAPDAYGPCFTRVPREPKGFAWVRAPGTPSDARCRSW